MMKLHLLLTIFIKGGKMSNMAQKICIKEDGEIIHRFGNISCLDQSYPLGVYIQIKKILKENSALRGITTLQAHYIATSLMRKDEAVLLFDNAVERFIEELKNTNKKNLYKIVEG